MLNFNKISSFLSQKFFPKNLKNKDIPLKQALKIQKQTTDQENVSTVCTPSYMLILPQLSSAKTQIFEAAVYSLFQIAVHDQKYQQELLKNLKEYIQTHQFSSERLKFIEKAAQEYYLTFSMD